jgi:valyl-tRNA synthetase
MKANLPTAEPKMLDRWNQDGLYPKIRTARSGRPMYVLHDGPPYANGDIHLGHAFNKILGITAHTEPRPLGSGRLRTSVTIPPTSPAGIATASPSKSRSMASLAPKKPI